MQRRVLAVLVAAVMLAGCGSSSDGDAASDAGATDARADAPPGFVVDAGNVGACGDAGALPLTGAFACPADAAVPSYTTDVAPILGACAGETCHGAVVPSHGVAPFVGVASSECCDHRPLVAPGDPARSHVLQKVLGLGCGGDRMPLGRTPLTSEQIDVLAAWVCAGARAD